MMTQTIAALIWFFGLIGWAVIRYPYERKAKRVRVDESLLDRRERSLLAVALLGLFVVPAVNVLTGFPHALDRPFLPLLAWLGLATLIAALWLFQRSHADLGRNWSITLQVRERHALVTRGVYRLIRHPMYSSFFLLGLAQMLLIPNWLADASGILGAGILYAFRVAREEQMMLDRFGDAYRVYMTLTKRIVPWII